MMYYIRASTVKHVLHVLVLVSLTVVVIYACLVWQNNKDTPYPEKQDIKASFERAVSWLQDNRSKVIGTNNPALWRMIQRGAKLTGDERLQYLFDAYHKRYFTTNKRGYTYLWYQQSGWAPISYEQIEHLADYQQFFAYALTCDTDLGRQQLIAAQNDSSYCDEFPLRSSCVTHQMMGLQLLLERGCGDPGKLSETMAVLQNRAAKQLTWDPRLLDQYLQRVLMLLDTGASSLVKPVWISRVINGYIADGGWPEKRTILNIPGKYDLVFTRNFIGMGGR